MTTEKTTTPDGFLLSSATNVRDEYTLLHVNKDEPRTGWPHSNLIIQRNLPDGTVEDVYGYTRNYSPYNTFEPFRQYRDGEWRDYALISSQYTRFEVVDLALGEIIATEAYPVVTQAQHDRWMKLGHPEWCEERPVGMELPGAGFCPVDFYVPSYEDSENDGTTREDVMRMLYDMSEALSESVSEDLQHFTGEFALYIGCVWGDDSSYKLQYIDLSRISEGIVTADGRFGYMPVARQRGQRLKDVITFYHPNQFQIAVETTVRLNSGKAYNSGINYVKDDDEWLNPTKTTD